MVNYNKIALEAAKHSPCKKRKVGAVVVGSEGRYRIGYNHNNDLPCELQGKTLATVIHAEIMALKDFKLAFEDSPIAIYITHPPCDNCRRAILDAGIKEKDIHIVEEFMKFDKGKLRYGLIPTEATKALAEVLTYGAKKYKPNNWQKGEPERYVDALYRHLEAWRAGEAEDSESGLSHLAHALTNIAFLLHFENDSKS